MEEQVGSKTLAFLLIVSVIISLAGILIILKTAPTITGATVTGDLKATALSSEFWDNSLTTIFIVLTFTLSFIVILAKGR